MIGMIKNDLISYQVYARLSANKAVNELKKRIADEKLIDNYQNYNAIFIMERELDKLSEAAMLAEIKKQPRFELLNNEKMTPHFINLVKQSKATESLAVIKDDRGDAFVTDKARNQYITNYYRRLYTKNANEVALTDTSISDFLGPDICQSSIVMNSKLTNEEKMSINGEFTLGELDKAASDVNAATAGGPDGIGNACIKKIWPYIRVPLKNLANHCLINGRLTDNFCTASIKLIPKKGDLTRITNWRPISLLNCLYKVISKAINERLRLVCNSVLSRAQKGFTKGRYIQECLLNIIETIHRSNKYKIPAFILALDQEKAFDSVRHDYMRKCFEFFGFPENFIRIIEVFTTNRTAHLILDGGVCSSNIDLQIGNTQGNGPSPLQFNICEQILFFKIELDPGLRSIFEPGANLSVILHRQPVPVFDNTVRDLFCYDKKQML
jgi:hypothetical protein